MELLDVVESLIDDGHLPDIVPDNGQYQFEVDGYLVRMEPKPQAHVLVSCVVADLAQVQGQLSPILEKWMSLSLAQMMEAESVFSFHEADQHFRVRQLSALEEGAEESLLGVLESVVGDAADYRRMLG